jgi:hypothetical protein
VPGLAADQLDTVLARGLGLDLERLREESGRRGVVEALAAQPVPVQRLEPVPLLEGAALDQLRLAAEADIARAATAAVQGDVSGILLRRPPRKPAPEAGRARRRKQDALDRLLKEQR